MFYDTFLCAIVILVNHNIIMFFHIGCGALTPPYGKRTDAFPSPNNVNPVPENPLSSESRKTAAETIQVPTAVFHIAYLFMIQKRNMGLFWARPPSCRSGSSCVANLTYGAS
jgi:hypothetical protein